MSDRAYLFDTTSLSVFGRLKSGGNDSLCTVFAKKLEGRQDARIVICPICVGELRRGALIKPDESILNYLKQIINTFQEVLPIDDGVADCYSILWARLFNEYASENKKAGSPGKIRMRELLSPTHTYDMQVQENDLWLAATAMYYKLILVTHDKMARLKSISDGDVSFEDWLVV